MPSPLSPALGHALKLAAAFAGGFCAALSIVCPHGPLHDGAVCVVSGLAAAGLYHTAPRGQ